MKLAVEKAYDAALVVCLVKSPNWIPPPKKAFPASTCNEHTLPVNVTLFPATGGPEIKTVTQLCDNRKTDFVCVAPLTGGLVLQRADVQSPHLVDLFQRVVPAFDFDQANNLVFPDQTKINVTCLLELREPASPIDRKKIGDLPLLLAVFFGFVGGSHGA